MVWTLHKKLVLQEFLGVQFWKKEKNEVSETFEDCLYTTYFKWFVDWNFWVIVLDFELFLPIVWRNAKPKNHGRDIAMIDSIYTIISYNHITTQPIN